jgi:hypothetical protein
MCLSSSFPSVLDMESVLQWKVDRVTANHSLSSTAIQQKFQHSLSLLSFSWDVTARHKNSLSCKLPGRNPLVNDGHRQIIMQKESQVTVISWPQHH